MNKELQIFIVVLTVILAIVFGIHIGILQLLNRPLFADSIILSYSINYALAITIFTVIILLKEKFKTSIGFIFLGGSMLKFVVFFIVFLPIFKADGTINNFEFASFFVPYIICLFIETLRLTDLLNKS